MPTSHLILVADGEPAWRRLTRTILEHHGFQVIESQDCETALAALQYYRPDVMVVDHALAGAGGIAVCTDAKDNCAPSMPVIMVTEDNGVDLLLRIVSAGADDLLLKPFAPEALIRAVQRVVREGPEVQAISGLQHRKQNNHGCHCEGRRSNPALHRLDCFAATAA